MRAMVITRFGGVDVFEQRELADPKPGPGELLVRVIASGTNPVDAKLRASGAWAKLQPPCVLGYDGSGVVEAVGPGVGDFAKGDEVFYTPEIFANPLGTYAELNVVPAAIVARKPKRLSHAEAAAVPLAGGTAYESLVRRLRLQVGQTILIHGGSGGVGSFAVQIAKAAGAKVIATASAAHQKTLRDLGAHVAVDYRSQDVVEIALKETGGRGVDAMFDVVGGENVARSLGAVRPFGHVATILAPKGELAALSHQNITLHGVFLTRERERLEALATLCDSGAVKPVIDRELPLEQVAQAHERLDSGHGRGKIVLRVSAG